MKSKKEPKRRAKKKLVQRQFKQVSARARTLLSRTEDHDCDWKSTHKLDMEDLVAFANSDQGGTILLGVEEEKSKSKGIQRARVVGCDISDQIIVGLEEKAVACTPSIDIQVFIEGTATTKPFLRVEIPSGKHRPYCTPTGLYRIRGEHKNCPLQPQHLLGIFVENESQRFIRNFEAATVQLQDTLTDAMVTIGQSTTRNIMTLNNAVDGVQTMIEMAIDDVKDKLEARIEELHERMNDSFERIESVLDQLERLDDVGEAVNTVEENVVSHLYDIERKLKYLLLGQLAQLKTDALEDPIRTYWRPYVHLHIKSILEMDWPDYPGDEWVIEQVCKMIYEKSPIIRELCLEAVENLKPQLSKKLDSHRSKSAKHSSSGRPV